MAKLIIEGGKSTFPQIENNFGQLLLDRMQENGTQIWQINPVTGAQITLKNLRQSSIRVALEMRKRGIQKGDLIMLCPKYHAKTHLPYFAAWYLGATVNTISPSFTHNEQIRLIKIISPKLLFCENEFLDAMRKLFEEAQVQTEFISYQDDFDPFLAPHEDEENFKAVQVDVETTNIMILNSSGTTSLIKGITHTHKTFYHALIDSEFVGEATDRMLTFSSLCWNSAIWIATYGILFGSTFLATEYPGPQKAMEIIEKFQVTFASLTPMIFNDFIKHPNFENVDFSHLRFAWSRGCVNTKDQMLLFRKKFPDTFILNACGMSEIFMLVASFNPRDPEEVQMNIDKIYSNGKLVRGVQAKVVDIKTGELLKRNQQGELYIKCNSLTPGYYKNPEADKSLFNDGWFATGDLVYFDDDDCLFITGRLKELLRYKGWTVMPAELEFILSQHPEVLLSCVVGIPAPIIGDLAVAFVLCKPNSKINEEELVQYVNNQVSDYQKLHGGVIFLESMPMTATGKIKRNELQLRAKEMAMKYSEN